MDLFGVIRCKRLILRPLRVGDAKAITAGIGQWEVIRWLTTPPWPYTQADAEWFLNDPMSAETFGIENDGALIGVVGLHPHEDRPGLELGYWLNRAAHGHAYMSEAARAVVANHFSKSEAPLVSGYLLGNSASAKVLRKLGFRATEQILRFARPIGYDVPLQRMELTKAQALVLPA